MRSESNPLCKWCKKVRVSYKHYSHCSLKCRRASVQARRPVCEWCLENKVKSVHAITCSRECGNKLKWWKLKQSGQDTRVLAMMGVRARQNKAALRLTAEIKRECEKLGIKVTPEIAKLYTRARNFGYRNGYSVYHKRMLAKGTVPEPIRKRKDNAQSGIPRSPRKDEGSSHQKERGLC